MHTCAHTHKISLMSSVDSLLRQVSVLYSGRTEPKWQGWDWIPAAVVVTAGKNDISKNLCKDAYIFHSKRNYRCSEPLTLEGLTEVLSVLMIVFLRIVSHKQPS